MKKSVLLIILIVLGLIYYLSFQYVYSESVLDITTQQMENAKVQANLVSKLLTEKLESGYTEQEAKEELQSSIENMSLDNSFICMFDNTGTEICHPNRAKIGGVLAVNNSVVKDVFDQSLEVNFQDAIMGQKEIGGLRVLEDYTEVIYLSPVQNTNWIVASHSNIKKYESIFAKLKTKLTVLFVFIWLGTALVIFLFLQYIDSKNLQKLSDLNRSAGSEYFEELREIKNTLKDNIINNSPRKDRLLADKGSKLVPVLFEDIAFIYTEDKITYIIEHSDKRSTINIPLDDLSSLLDSEMFYRTSRQSIVSIKAIDKIEKRGKTQLCVLTKPDSPIDIIVSKAKLMDFKKWIG